MIAWSKYYNFAAEDVSYLESGTDTGSDYPYRLTVHFKNGKAISVSYQDAKSRDSARADMVRQIERVRREDTEFIMNQLTLLNYAYERIEKRQLRIWRQLKALLGISMEDE